MPFVHHHTVRFHEADPGGVVFFANYFRFAHDAFEAVMSVALDGLMTAFERDGFGTPLVRCEADYRRPIRGGERICIEVWWVSRTRSTAAFEHRVLGADGELRATLKLVHAFIDRDFKSLPRPEIFDDAMARAGLRLEAPPSHP